MDLGALWQIYGLRGFGELRDAPWTPVTQPRLQGEESEHVSFLAEMRRGDILVHHPYDSFATSVERFVEQAVADPDVLAIKQTVYRTSDDSPLVPALIRATERGKQAVCMVELKARFDERANIAWARALEEAGVHVVYGHPGLKTHAKCILVVRREGDGVRHYVHIGTGNYHPKTARLYTDFGLFTTDEQIGADVADMFNFLTGMARPSGYRKLLIAPNGLREAMLAEIDATIAAHERGEHARIALKMNSLVDRRMHPRAVPRVARGRGGRPQRARDLLPAPRRRGRVGEDHASSACSGASSSTRASTPSSAAAATRVLIGSADLMPRNLDTRVELVTPVEDDALRDDLLDTLERSLADDVGAWELRSDGSWSARDARRPAALGPARAHGAARRARQRGHIATSDEPERRGRAAARGAAAAPAGRARPRAGARQPPPAAAAGRRRRRPAGQGVVARRGRQRRAPAHVRPLVGAHPDRAEHRAAPVAAAVRARRDAEHRRRPRHEAARRGGRDRRRGAVALRRHVDPPHRPRGVFAVHGLATSSSTLLEPIYDEPERSIVVAETMHAIISHRSRGAPFTIEGAIVRVADALDMARGRSRVPFEAGHTNIHSLSAYAIEEVKLVAGEDKAVRVEIAMSNSAGIFQVDEGLGTKLRGTPLEQHIEVVARIEAEHEQRLVPIFRL